MSIQPFDVSDRDVPLVMLVTFFGRQLRKQANAAIAEIQRTVPPSIGFLALTDIPEGSDPTQTKVLELRGGKSRHLHSYPSDRTTAHLPDAVVDFLKRGFRSFTNARFVVGFRSHGDFLESSFIRTLRRTIRGLARAIPPLTQHLPRRLQPLPHEINYLLPVESDRSVGLSDASDILREALEQGRDSQPVDLLFFDTCANGCVEVFHELGFFAKTFIGSQTVEPVEGWLYGVTGQRRRCPIAQAA